MIPGAQKRDVHRTSPCIDLIRQALAHRYTIEAMLTSLVAKIS